MVRPPVVPPVYGDSRLPARFWSKVRVNEATGCWEWIAYLGRWGYGQFGRGKRAHRVAYEALVGPIPDGLQTDHLCRVRNCVNPAHLEPVTGRENTLRSQSWAAVNAAKKDCVRGHPLSGDNVYINHRGHRECRACRRYLNLVYKRYRRRLAKADTALRKGEGRDG